MTAVTLNINTDGLYYFYFILSLIALGISLLVLYANLSERESRSSKKSH